MADEVDVLVQQWLSRWEQIRHSENQRATMTNMLLVLAAAGLGLISQKRLEPGLLLVSGALLFLGIFGVLASLKYYERFRVHLREAGAIRKKIDERFPGLGLEGLAETTWREHEVAFPRLAKMPLYSLWVALHVGIGLVGGLISAVILARL
ncbi:hypothetical protein ACPSM1_30890 [Micromonospora chersina]|uniref:hypothetical protein n=1 Tax=Micromonospora chersina TaxID=47854 RepID=UPI003CB25AC0